MDGTLIDSKKDITISINYVREKNYALPPLSEDFIVEAINMEVRNLPKLFYDTDVYRDADRELFETHYEKQCTQNPYLYNGVVTLLKSLKNENIKLSVATNAPTKFAKEILSSLQVAELFDVIIGADKVAVSKPDPSLLNAILEFYGFDKKQDKAWMIGDNSKDIKSAENAGINAIFATWGFSPYSDFEVVVKEPKEVLNIVL